MTARAHAHTLYFDRAQTEGGLVAGPDRPVVASSASEWHRQATVAANPADPEKIIAACYVAFIAPEGEEAPTDRVSVSYSTDGGLSWRLSTLPPVAGSVGVEAFLDRPVLAFGPDGVAYLLTIEDRSASAGATVRPPPVRPAFSGTPHIFRSADNGATWTAAKAPREVLASPWLACDPARPGRLYVTTGFFHSLWVDESGPRTAAVWRSDDAGETWSLRTALREDSGRDALAWAPHVSVAADGTVHVVGIATGRDTADAIWHWRSKDAGQTFTTQRAANPVPRSTSADPSGEWEWVNGYAAGSRFVITWADSRDGVSRVYYRATDEGGATWVGPDAGTTLLPGLPATSGAHHLRPRLAATAQGAVGCAFYELAPAPGGQRLTMMLAAAVRWEDGFGPPVAVSDTPWKPDQDASEPFVGDYFGVAADASSFLVLWPEAPAAPTPERPSRSEDIWVHQASGHWFVIRIRSGKVIGIVRIPPRGPVPRTDRESDVVRALRALEAPGALDAGERVHELGTARTLGHALREVAVLVEGAALVEARAPAEERRR